MNKLFSICWRQNTVAASGLLMLTFPAAAQTASEPGLSMQVLGMFYAARDTDDKCGGLSVEERQILDELIAHGLKEAQPSPEQRDALENGLFKDGIDCDNPGFIEMYRALSLGDTSEDAGVGEVTDDAIKQQLETVVSELPAGQLGHIKGCWLSDQSGWNLRLCFTGDGDGAEMALTQGESSVTCVFDGGQARSREGGAFFYAYSASQQCTDGRSIGHVEGWCPELGQTEMRCLVSIYEHSNVFFTDKQDGTEPLNGELRFVRQ